jgi:hypothetical protein
MIPTIPSLPGAPSLAARSAAARGGPPGLSISLGVRSLTRPSIHHFAKWLGKYPDYMMIFCDDLNSWAGSLTKTQNEIVSLGLLWGGYTERPLKIEWVFPLCTTAQNCAVTAAGTVDATLTSMFQAIAAADDNSEVWIRLGWEFNITAYPWNTVSANSKADYIAAFQHVVTLARAIDSRFKFTWCPNWAAENPELSYPGDSYVDVAGMDCYFKTQFDQNTGQTGAQVWTHKREADYGLDWLVAFAAAHDIRWALCEYGGNADEPVVMQGFADFIKEFRPKYHGLWDQSTDPAALCRLSNKAYPGMGVVYVDEFGVPGAQRDWDPLLYFGTDLLTWYDASKEGSFTIDAGLVTRWYPEFGEAKYAIQGTSVNKPTRSATARNSLPGVTFDGTADNLVQADVTNHPAGQAAISYAAQIYGGSGVGAFAYAFADTDATGGLNQRQLGAGSTGRPMRFQANGALSTTGLTMVNADRAVTVSVPAGATPTVSLVAGGAAAQTAAIAINAFTPTKVVLGAGGATSDGIGAFWVGTIQERICVKRALTSDEVDKLHGYLAHKWKGDRASVALPGGHPYFAAPPQL